MHRTYLAGHLTIDDWYHPEELQIVRSVGRIFEMDPTEDDLAVLTRYERLFFPGRLTFGKSSSHLTEIDPIMPESAILVGHLVRTIRSGILVRPIYFTHPVTMSQTPGLSVTKMILDEMEEVLLLDSWSYYLEEWARRKENWQKRHPEAPPMGGTYTLPKTVPDELHKEAGYTARQLYRKIETSWGKALGRPIDLAHFVYRILLDRTEAATAARKLLDEWSYKAVMSGLGSGTWWGDSQPELTAIGRNQEVVELEVPSSCIEGPMWYVEGEEDRESE